MLFGLSEKAKSLLDMDILESYLKKIKSEKQFGLSKKWMSDVKNIVLSVFKEMLKWYTNAY